MMRILFYLSIAILAIILQACPPPYTPEKIVYDPIPDSILSKIPYQEDSSYFFQHSKGEILEFNCNTKLSTETPCTHGLCWEYEQYSVTLSSSYPISPIEMNIRPISDSIFDLWFWFSMSSFQHLMPIQSYEVKDTVLFNDQLHEVWMLTSYNANEEQLNADTILYSYEKGILQISMSNGEKFVRYED